jgi:glucokinase
VQIPQVQIPFPILVCDIGGTNVRSSFVEAPGGPLEALPARRTDDFPGLAEAALGALEGQQKRPRSMLVCAAGPCEGTRVKLTNADWVIEGRDVAQKLGLSQGLMFNDFEAQALSLPSLRDEWCLPIGEPLTGDGGPLLISGPGTGLGTAALIKAEGKWRAIASESGHLDFAPVTEEERAFWPHVEPVLGRLTPEALVSGPGLRRLHRARLAAKGQVPPELSSPEIVERALVDPTSEEAATARAFWLLAARFAGDMALTFLTTGGVTLAGGMLPRLLPLLDAQAFRAAFERKAPYDWLAKRIPVRLLIEADTVLAGLADIAARPEAYAIDYSSRAWV